MLMQAAFVLTDLTFLAAAGRQSWTMRLAAAALLVPMAVGVGLARVGGGWAMLSLWLLAVALAVRCSLSASARTRLQDWIAAQDARSDVRRARRLDARVAAATDDPNEAARLSGSLG